jgi:hypothetical protein
MPAPIYDAVNSANVALTGGATRTVLGVKAHANSGLLLVDWDITFDGVTASNVPGLVELCYCTWATNSPGTASTSVTVTQRLGRALTAGFTAGETWTTEPTVLTVIRRRRFTPNGGVLVYDYPLGKEPDCALGEGFAIRCNFAAAVNVVASMGVSRC